MLALFGTSPAWSQSSAEWVIEKVPELSRKIDVVHERYLRPHSPGAIVAVVRGGEIIHLKGYGLADREFGIPWDPAILYTFYSTTKPMTATAIFTLARQGRLSLDDEIQKYLPDFPRFSTPITIRHLLNHTSGIWEDESVIHLAGVGMAYQAVTLDEMYALGRKQKTLPFRPGSDWYYNDTGERYAARIIERITGKSFGAAMRELLYDPAGMPSAVVSPYFEPYWFPRQAKSYLLDKRPDADLARDPLLLGELRVQSSGDGGSAGSITDLIRLGLYLSKGFGNGSSFLEELTAPFDYRRGFPAAYRYSMQVHTFRGLDVYEHGGLYGKRFAYLPRLDTWVIMMRNALDYRHASDNRRLEEILDPVLAHDPRAAWYLSDRNPRREETLSRPSDQKFTDFEFAALSGTFAEPQSGTTLTLRRDGHRIGYEILGDRRWLARETGPDGRPHKRRYFTYSMTFPVLQMELAGSSNENARILIQRADWSGPRALARVDLQQLSPLSPAALNGAYLSREFGALYYLQLGEDNQLSMQIGAGARATDRWTLKRVADDVFEGAQDDRGSWVRLFVTLRLTRSDGKVTGFQLSSADVHNLQFDRVPQLRRSN